MTTRFTIAATDYEYLTDRLRLNAPEVDGDLYEYLGGRAAVDIRRVRLEIEIIGVWEQVAGPALSCFGLWRLLALNEGSVVHPDDNGPSIIEVLPALQPPRPYATKQGAPTREQSLKLVAAQRYALDDPIFPDLEALTSPLTS